jgi:hypothetical protein
VGFPLSSIFKSVQFLSITDLVKRRGKTLQGLLETEDLLIGYQVQTPNIQSFSLGHLGKLLRTITYCQRKPSRFSEKYLWADAYADPHYWSGDRLPNSMIFYQPHTPNAIDLYARIKEGILIGAFLCVTT